MRIWVTVRRMHLTQACAGPTAVEMDTEQAPLREPCANCLPEIYKKFRDTHRKVCPVCSPLKLMPCVHNGGAQVKTTGGNQWTWPERTLLRPVVGYGNINHKEAR